MKETIKLRNKKTGEIGELIGSERSCPYITIGIDFHDGNPKAFYYTSLTELNEEWEDYRPPFIRDKANPERAEKIRKLVRDWATLNEIVRARIQREDGENSWFKIYGQDEALQFWYLEIHAPYIETVSKDYRGNMTPINDLCGEEEE